MITKNGPFDSRTFQSLAPVRQSIEREFRHVRNENPVMFRLALNEAEALAGQAGFPQLLFPVLAREKAQQAGAWLQRQKIVRRQSGSIAFSA